MFKLKLAFTTLFVVLIFATSGVFGQAEKIVKLTADESDTMDKQMIKKQALPLAWSGPQDPGLPSISNGCGPQIIPHWPAFANEHSFSGTDTATGQVVSYLVNFKAACDLHDAGYAGLNVWDQFGVPIAPGIRASVDFSTWGRADVDKKLFRDMQTLCDKGIPVSNTGARQKCKGWEAGAQSYYFAVMKAGYLAFDTDLTADGCQPWGGTRKNYWGYFNHQEFVYMSTP